MTTFGFSFYLSYGLYGQRPLTHMDAYRAAPGMYAVEVASWRLELVKVPSRADRFLRLATMALLVTVSVTGVDGVDEGQGLAKKPTIQRKAARA